MIFTFTFSIASKNDNDDQNLLLATILLISKNIFSEGEVMHFQFSFPIFFFQKDLSVPVLCPIDFKNNGKIW
jgi:hypothetical protein